MGEQAVADVLVGDEDPAIRARRAGVTRQLKRILELDEFQDHERGAVVEALVLSAGSVVAAKRKLRRLGAEGAGPPLCVEGAVPAPGVEGAGPATDQVSGEPAAVAAETGGHAVAAPAALAAAAPRRGHKRAREAVSQEGARTARRSLPAAGGSEACCPLRPPRGSAAQRV